MRNRWAFGRSKGTLGFQFETQAPVGSEAAAGPGDGRVRDADKEIRAGSPLGGPDRSIRKNHVLLFLHGIRSFNDIYYFYFVVLMGAGHVF